MDPTLPPLRLQHQSPATQIRDWLDAARLQAHKFSQLTGRFLPMGEHTRPSPNDARMAVKALD